VVGGLGSVVSGLGSALGLGAVTGPLLDPLVDGLNSIAGKKHSAPAHAAPARASPAAAPIPAPASPSPASSWWGSTAAAAPAAAAKPPERADASVTVHGINVLCRQHPDDFTADPARAIRLSGPARIDPVCWSPTTPGAQTTETYSWWLTGGGREEGWLMTKANCYIKPSEVEEIRDYRSILPACQPVRHWVGTLSPQYSRKDCYYCPSTSACGSEDLATAPPYVDIACYTQGDEAGGNSTWFRNADKNCFFPGAVFDPLGFRGVAGGRC
jgi:hypothetical protein